MIYDPQFAKYIDIRQKMWYFIGVNAKKGSFRSDSFQRVPGWCEGIRNAADCRPGADFLKWQ